MKFQLKIDENIFEKFPTYQALVIYAENLVNGESDAFSRQILREAENHAITNFQNVTLTEHFHIAAWRDAFRQFGAKPKKYQCGAEALLRRVLSGHSISPINRLVDIYNAISLRYAIPVGGEDLEGLRSDLILIEADGDEPFEMISNGVPETTHPEKGEIVWADRAGCTVRRWNWRQTKRTQITAQSRHCYFVLDRLAPLETSALQTAGADLIALLRKISPGAEIYSDFLSKDS